MNALNMVDKNNLLSEFKATRYVSFVPFPFYFPFHLHLNLIKAKLPQEGILFRTQFPSLGFF